MSAAAVCITLLVFLALGAPVTLLILRDEAAKRREWRPAGYSAKTGPDWWTRPLPPIGLAQNVRMIDAPPAAELVSVADPRVITSNRRLAPPATRKRVERVRRVEKRRPRAQRGAA